MRKQTKSKPTVHWINLYWAEMKQPSGDYPFCDLMCSPAEYATKREADTEWRINRLMFEEVRRVGNQAHRITFREKESC
jgi:hypothetical protein